jgi:hypothetical protein
MHTTTKTFKEGFLMVKIDFEFCFNWHANTPLKERGTEHELSSLLSFSSCDRTCSEIKDDQLLPHRKHKLKNISASSQKDFLRNDVFQ